MNSLPLAPERVFFYFSEISAIPHGSGNTEQLRQYCAGFAQQHGLAYVCDDAGNIIIRKPASAGYEHAAPVILQGHLDMVCEKEPSCTIDLAHEGIRLCYDDTYVFADGTTLGADDGIAVAYALAVLEDDSLAHPPLEVLLTTDEEIGLLGANGLDCTQLSGTRLINIDSETEGVLTVGCAGGVRCTGSVPLQAAPLPPEHDCLRLTVSGLRGGHSGIDIGKNRANAIVLLARLVQQLTTTLPGVRLCSLQGGSKDNVIPKSAAAVIAVPQGCDVYPVISSFSATCKQELHHETVVFHLEACEQALEVLEDSAAQKLLFLLQHCPNGVIELHPDMPGMVLTSLNLGTAVTEDAQLKLSYMLRSNTIAGRKALETRLVSFLQYLGASVELSASYAPWEYRKDSPLRETMLRTFRSVYGKDPVIETIHAGLECAVFDGGIPDADMISFGPDIENAHTPDERLRIQSVQNCWELLCKLLEQLND